PPPADLPVAAPPPPADRPEESTPPPADPVPDLPVEAEPLPAAAPPAPAPAPAPAAGAGPARAAREVLAQRGLLADKTPPILDKASAVTPTPPPPPGAARTIGAAKGTASDDLAPTPPPTAPPHAPGSNSPVFDDGTPLPAPPSDSDEPEPGPAPAVERQPAAPASSGDGPAVADVSATFDDLLSALSNKGRALLRPAQVVSSSAGKVVLGLPNEVHAQKAKEFGPELAAALSSRFGGALAVEFGVAGDPLPPAPSAPVAEAIAPPVERAPVGPQSVPPAPEPGAETPVSAPPPAVVEPPPPAPTPEPPTSSAPAPAVEPSASAGDSVDDFDPDTDIGNIADLADATDVASSYVDRLTEAFPGAEVVEPDQSPGGPS
ncbi:MAG: hypothetical protein GY929_22250, partial [Actinomycetia bacterium]|nr:hypothetical protein [Actinomycetes bacterium]